MKLPRFQSLQRAEKASKLDEQVFAEASELALLRLEQCIADLRIWIPTVREVTRAQHRSLKKFPGLY